MKLDGWGAIAAHLTQAMGVGVSIEQARRWARRALDPLPIARVGRMGRKRVIADSKAVQAWAVRELAA